ncbi:hypothetical protein PR202_ga21258 [Eleusine coracana subsp. coracana]|uniref:Alpha/beta hydrolase fold-3 domain-containing protein n=1 Tax=Eleusine coracana subsp. coracana TaxID=191504 RepID=A0AAV5D0K1_ELECO|nr:hypothetical protein PR202_ga21258 [Eleusine coracana subsp. coracana]
MPASRVSVVVVLLGIVVALLCASSPVGAREAQNVVESASAFRSRATDPNTEVKFDFTPFLIQYRSGRVQRLMGTSVVPATSLDPRTGVSSRDVVVDAATGLAARLYLPSSNHHLHRNGKGGKRLPVLLYFHGGAFVVESAFGPAYHGYLNALAAKAGVLAVSVNYRLAPEHPLPAAYDDAWAALQWVLRNARADPWLARHADVSRVYLAGDSAGGNIAHNLAMRVGEQQHHQFLLSGLTTTSSSSSIIKGVALLDPYFLGGRQAGPAAARAWGFICAGRYGTGHPYVNPAAGLPRAAWRWMPAPRVLVTVSGRDGLGPWQRAYVDAVRASGWPGTARLYVTPGEGHCFFLSNLQSPKAAMHMATLAAFVNGAS